jgi:hypothetical protein
VCVATGVFALPFPRTPGGSGGQTRIRSGRQRQGGASSASRTGAGSDTRVPDTRINLPWVAQMLRDGCVLSGGGERTAKAAAEHLNSNAGSPVGVWGPVSVDMNNVVRLYLLEQMSNNLT